MGIEIPGAVEEPVGFPVGELIELGRISWSISTGTEVADSPRAKYGRPDGGESKHHT